MFIVLKNDAEINYKERIHNKTANQNYRINMIKICFKGWFKIVKRSISERIGRKKVLTKHNKRVKAIFFDLLKHKFDKRKKQIMNENIANFKYTQRITKTSLRSLSLYSIRKKLSEILIAKSDKMKWTRLATLGFAVFFHNLIRVKENINIKAKVTSHIIID